MTSNLTDIDRKALKTLCESAARNPRSVRDVMWAIKNPTQERNRNFAETIRLSNGCMITFTHEEQPAGLMRHLSVSYRGGSVAPPPAIIGAIMETLGFANELEKCLTWNEEFEPGRHAINVLEPVADPAQRTSAG